ncbi:hypothetical protein IWZ01DRAFT_338552 [Phyllosticta capitalensis]
MELLSIRARGRLAGVLGGVSALLRAQHLLATRRTAKNKNDQSKAQTSRGHGVGGATGQGRATGKASWMEAGRQDGQLIAATLHPIKHASSRPPDGFFQPRAASLVARPLASRPEWIKRDALSMHPHCRLNVQWPTTYPLPPLRVANNFFIFRDVTYTLQSSASPSRCSCCLANAPRPWSPFVSPALSPQGNPTQKPSLYLKCPHSAVHALDN